MYMYVHIDFRNTYFSFFDRYCNEVLWNVVHMYEFLCTCTCVYIYMYTIYTYMYSTTNLHEELDSIDHLLYERDL